MRVLLIPLSPALSPLVPRGERGNLCRYQCPAKWGEGGRRPGEGNMPIRFCKLVQGRAVDLSRPRILESRVGKDARPPGALAIAWESLPAALPARPAQGALRPPVSETRAGDGAGPP
jgi:hypothetical protein